MLHLFSPEGHAALANTLAQRPLAAFDFDGTLAPIVARPDDARVPLAVAWRLARLADILPLAIISGRRVDDIRGRLAFEPRFIVGSHGAENPSAPAPNDYASALDGIRTRLHEYGAELRAAGITVEDKYLSIALHYRLAPDRKLALGLITNLVYDLDSDVEIFGGKMVANLVPSQAPGKADALARLIVTCGAQSALFVGDDINDEPVFARLEPTWLTVRVGRDYPNSMAKFCLDGSAEVASMLDKMLALLSSSDT